MSLRAPIFLLLLMTAAPSGARADAGSDALERFREGSRLFEARDYAGARAAFQEAYRILPNPRVLGNIATCLAAEGQTAEAVTAYRRFLHEAGDQVPAAARSEAERQIRRLGSSVGDLIVVAEPDGAEVLIDGRTAGTTPIPWPLAVLPGRRLVEIRAAGRASISRELEVTAAREQTLTAILQPLPAPRQPAPPPEAVTPAGPPPPRLSLPASPHSTTTTPLGRGPLLWTGVAATGALAIGAAVTGLLALSQLDEYEARETPPERRRELFDSTNTLTDVTDVLIWSAVVCAAATTALYFLAGPRTEDGPGEAERGGETRWHLALGF